MTNRKIPNVLKEKFPIILIANAIFFNLARFICDYWALSARIMIFLFVLFVPVIIWILHKLKKKVLAKFLSIDRKRLITLAVSSCLFGAVCTLGYPHVFNTTIMITPVLSENQTIELMELKANGYLIPLTTQASNFGWDIVHDVFVAKKSSHPLKINLELPANAPIYLLFNSSPESGNALVSYGYRKDEVILNKVNSGEKLFNAYTHYRNFPNWLLLPFLTGIDFIAFSVYALALLILQEKGQKQLEENANRKEVFFSHQTSLIILLTLAAILHLINSLSVPLIMGVDSPSYLRGAVHLVNFGNFEGVSITRGPGTTLLFAPVIATFGRNPWGMKVLLHLLAIACVALAYRLAWQLNGKRWIAFTVGFATLLLPDLYFFSNYVMSDLPNIFITSLFCTLLISAMQTNKHGWIFSSLLVASFAILLRSENIVMLVIGVAALAVPPLWNRLKDRVHRNMIKTDRQKSDQLIGIIGLAFMLAILPVLWWSVHNYRNHGFFGMSNYAGEVFYTGWVYYGEAKGIPITDRNSQAVKEIRAAVAQYPVRLDESGVPTGRRAFTSLIRAGYSREQAFGLLSAAAWDSILNNLKLTQDVLRVKVKDSLTPITTEMITFELPGEEGRNRRIESQFFDAESLRLPVLIHLQHIIYSITQKWFDSLYSLWIWIGLLSLYFCLHRRQTLIWGALVLITFTRIFIPDIMGNPVWRYTLLGVVLLQLMAISWIAMEFCGIKTMVIDNEKKL